jgi:hypothetical protein
VLPKGVVSPFGKADVKDGAKMVGFCFCGGGPNMGPVPKAVNELVDGFSILLVVAAVALLEANGANIPNEVD